MSRNVFWLGVVSYGIYLWHLPLVSKVGHALQWTGVDTTGLPATVLLFLLIASVSVACAALSYYVVERPILRFKERRRREPKLRAAPVVPAES